MMKFELSRVRDRLLNLLHFSKLCPEKAPKYVLQNNIALRREALNLTQSELAEACGTSILTLKAVEEFDYIPSLTLALIFAAYFDCTVEEIFEFKRLDHGDF